MKLPNRSVSRSMFFVPTVPLLGLLMCFAVIPTSVLPSQALAAERRSSATKEELPKISVKVKDTKLRSAPKVWASGVADLKFGDTLQVVGTDASWFKVKTAKGQEGFIHPAAVTDRKIVLSSSKVASTKVDSADVVLAGKGFNQEIERAYARDNPGNNFKKVDQVGAVKISESEMRAFLKAGKLGRGEL